MSGMKPAYVVKKGGGEKLERITGLFPTKSGKGFSGKAQDGTQWFLFSNDDGSTVLRNRAAGAEKISTVTPLTLNAGKSAYTGDGDYVVFIEKQA